MRIPTKKQSFQLICQMEMLDHIVGHSLQVCRVATNLVDYLTDPCPNLNRDLVQAAALLHDITKTRSFKTNENHALTGARFLSERGYPEVGSIVRQHVQLDAYFVSTNPTEAEIVNYADKRVLHEEVVTLKERKNYIIKKYAKNQEHLERIGGLWKKTKQLEDKFFNCLSFSPSELNRFLKPEDCSAELSAYHKICAQL
jgi:putative nucleotidyltransferase with HDIG domain